jgi:hypothetical protein
MAVRFRAHLRYNVGSGYAQWLYDQMQVRMGMAFHLREGGPGQELSHATRDIVTTGPTAQRRENITIDVLWPDDRDDLAADTIATVEATVPWLRSDDPSPGDGRSWMDTHWCRHDLDPPEGCLSVWSWP